MENIISTEQESPTQEVRKIAEDYLDENYKFITGLRARMQFFMAGNLAFQEIGAELVRMGYPEDSWPKAFLCEISDTETAHEQNIHDFNPKTHAKGFYLNNTFATPGDELRSRVVSISFIELDAGLSRKFYDDKTGQEKKEFLAKILERPIVQTPGDDKATTYPPHAVVLMSDKAGKYQIEDLAVSDKWLANAPNSKGQ